MKVVAIYTAVVLSCVCVEAVGPQTSWSRPDAPLDILYDNFFKDLDSARPCVGMNVNDGPAQCFAEHSTGPLYLIDDITDIDGLKGEGGMWNVIIGNNLPSSEVIPFLSTITTWNTTVVNGVFLRPLKTSELPDGYSPQPVRPLSEVDIYHGNQPAWNPHGGDLWAKKLPLIVYLSDSDHEAALQKAKKNKNSGYNTSPKESMQVNYVMRSRGMNTTECVKSGDCDVLGKTSYWGTTIGTEQINNETKYIGIALPITGTSLFTELYVPSQGAVIGSIVTALSFADAISEHRNKLNKEILFMFFDSEQYGSAGSFRFFKDITDWECLSPPDDPSSPFFCDNPRYVLSNFTQINHNNIEYLIGLDQLGVTERGTTYNPSAPDLFMYYDGVMYDRNPSVIDTMMTAFTKHGAKESKSRRFLPPSPVQSYLRIDESNRERASLSVGVLAGYDGSYNNKFYGSVYDTADLKTSNPRLNASLLLNATTTLLGAIWELAEGEGSPPPVNESLLTDLLQCLGSDINCPLVQGYIDKCYGIPQEQKYKTISNMYPGLSKDGANLNPVSRFIYNFMADRLALEESSLEPCFMNKTCPGHAPCGNNKEVCISNFDGVTGTCKLSPIFAHSAVSPAFFVNNSKWDFDKRFAYLPMWAESVWQTEMGSRLFTSDSNIHEATILIVGIIISLLSAAGIYFFRSLVVPKLKAD